MALGDKLDPPFPYYLTRYGYHALQMNKYTHTPPHRGTIKNSGYDVMSLSEQRELHIGVTIKVDKNMDGSARLKDNTNEHMYVHAHTHTHTKR